MKPERVLIRGYLFLYACYIILAVLYNSKKNLLSLFAETIHTDISFLTVMLIPFPWLCYGLYNQLQRNKSYQQGQKEEDRHLLHQDEKIAVGCLYVVPIAILIGIILLGLFK